MKQKLIKELHKLIDILDEKNIEEILLPIIVNLSTDKNWRVRLLISEYIAKFSKKTN